MNRYQKIVAKPNSRVNADRMTYRMGGDGTFLGTAQKDPTGGFVIEDKWFRTMKELKNHLNEPAGPDLSVELQGRDPLAEEGIL